MADTNRDMARGANLLRTVLHHAHAADCEVLRAVVDTLGFVVVTLRGTRGAIAMMESLDATLEPAPDWIQHDGWWESRAPIGGVYLRLTSPRFERRAASRS